MATVGWVSLMGYRQGRLATACHRLTEVSTVLTQLKLAIGAPHGSGAENGLLIPSRKEMAAEGLKCCAC
jgi:hypothetical protein